MLLKDQYPLSTDKEMTVELLDKDGAKANEETARQIPGGVAAARDRRFFLRRDPGAYRLRNSLYPGAVVAVENKSERRTDKDLRL